MSWSMTLRGFKELDAMLGALPDEVAKRTLRTALRRPSQLLADSIARRAPTLTGFLESSIDFIIRASEHGMKSSIGPGPGAFYGAFEEFGTIHQPARPFMRPALDEDGPAAVTALGDDLADGVVKAARRLSRKVG